ncbi:MAG TPA: sigma 54-interacting transcriptional regulator, partial [Nitrospinota bacterium]|nr:sigma 54-interacting transcriptional regulator [Nitrospinota bacterium]
LLRILEGGDFKKIGSNKMFRVDIRIIAATNSNLIMAIKNNSFREDLYYRLNVVSINLPPLRERIEDIPFLAMHFLKKASEKFKKPLTTIAPEVIQSFTRYSWPGNIRELENFIESATILTNSTTISPQDLPTLSEKIGINPRKTRLTDLPFYEARDLFEKEYIEKILSRCDGNISKASKLGRISRKSLRTKAKKYNLM